MTVMTGTVSTDDWIRATKDLNIGVFIEALKDNEINIVSAQVGDTPEEGAALSYTETGRSPQLTRPEQTEI